MKKFIYFITAVIIFASTTFCFTPQTVCADYSYARVITTDTPFYKNADDTLPLFFLPYTYYVKRKEAKYRLHFYNRGCR